MDSSRFLINFQRALKSRSAVLAYRDSRLTNYKLLNILHNCGFIQSYEQRGQYTLVYIKSSVRRGRDYSLQQCISILKPSRLYKKTSINSKQVWKGIKTRGESVLNIIHTDRGLLNSRKINNLGGVPYINIY